MHPPLLDAKRETILKLCTNTDAGKKKFHPTNRIRWLGREMKLKMNTRSRLEDNSINQKKNSIHYSIIAFGTHRQSQNIKKYHRFTFKMAPFDEAPYKIYSHSHYTNVIGNPL